MGVWLTSNNPSSTYSITLNSLLTSYPTTIADNVDIIILIDCSILDIQQRMVPDQQIYYYTQINHDQNLCSL